MSDPGSGVLTRGFQLGVQVLSYGAAWSEIEDVVQMADGLGYDYVLGADHLWATGGDPLLSCFEGWTTVAAWAGTVRKARIGLLVTANSFRNPGLVAKMVTTIDHISSGRAVLGLGAGWWAGEQRAHGIDVGTGLAERIEWLDESAGIIRALLDGEEVSSDDHYKFSRVRHSPRPMGKVPFLMGAAGERGIEIAGRRADIWHAWIGPDEISEFRSLSDALDRACLAAGREPTSVLRLPGCKMILRSMPAAASSQFGRLMETHRWPEEVRRHAWLGTDEWAAARMTSLAEAGASGMILQVAIPYDVETIERLARHVLPSVDAALGAAR
jgi:alkanesulfonate monooxygenase SsuD/methylene tetrahydromethanopterin reductase-like flavin-dependent oxidoreductase (luciferase family)